MTCSASDRLREGSDVIRPVLVNHGFRMTATDGGPGSGGPFAIGTWQRADGLEIQTHVRDALGIVLYKWNGESFTHQEYMRVRGVRGAYPGFSSDPLDGFRHLATGFVGPASGLLDATESDFRVAARAVRDLPKPPLP